ncbi:hypothetical protein [Amycolatopsis pigmentata]|uniref:Uncharacterized protein n=1 Tax=Amycolatopsis pigmentata TaxID=450801 RepID=A0ABW5G3Z2_9PSEU
MTPAEQRTLDNLVDAILDTDSRTEPVHERDCPACDIASEIAGTLAAEWDPHENWHDTTVSNGLPGDTVLDQATRIAAHVLHRRLPGHQRSRRAS